MNEDLIKRLRDSEHEIDCSLCDRDCCYPDGKVHGKCIIIEAADAIEAQDRRILTLQHEMMAEAECHIADVKRLNKQIEKLQADMRPVVLGQWIDYPECLKYPNAYSDDHIICSACEECFSILDNDCERFNFCPNCGADMRELPKEEST